MTLSPPSPWVVRFAPLVPTGAPVLDLAAGSGRHARLFLERGHPVTAVDRDPAQLDRLADWPGLEVIAVDLQGSSRAQPTKGSSRAEPDSPTEKQGSSRAELDSPTENQGSSRAEPDSPTENRGSSRAQPGSPTGSQGSSRTQPYSPSEENGAAWPLSGRRFGAVVVVNYLWRPLWPRLLAAVAEDGVLIYATFMAGNERFGHPANPDFLLRPGELLDVVRGTLEVVAFEQGAVAGPRPAVRQRLCAVRRTAPVALPA